MKQITDKAIVLSRTNYGERDRIITVIGQSSGKVTLFAKGVRAQKSKLAGGIELLCVTDITYIEGKSDLKTLTSTRLVAYYENLATDISRMQQAFTAIKAINTISEDGGGQEYFELLSSYFSWLDDLNYDVQIVELWFNLRLLSSTGTIPRTDIEPTAQTQKYFSFNHETQSFESHSDGQYSFNDIKLIKLLSTRQKPVKLQSQTGSEPQLVKLSRMLLKSNITEV